MTHTFAELEVSESTYDEVHKLLLEAGYEHAFIDTEEGLTIDMHGIGLTKKWPKCNCPLPYTAMKPEQHHESCPVVAGPISTEKGGE